jgi:predicted nuclease with TOPRIM domain
MRKLEEIIRELPENIRGPIYEAFVAFRDDIILKETREIKSEIGRVWEVIKELAESQRRTEQEIEKIWGAIKELTEAQRKTEESLKKLIEDHSKTREKLEGLSDSFGYLLEDRAMKSLPKILKRKYNIKAVGNFVRDYFIINGEHVEVNIFGRVKKGNKEYILIGEAKSQVTKKAIDKFLKKCDKISGRFSKETIKVFISYIFSPGIKEYAEEKGIVLIPSYELDL